MNEGSRDQDASAEMSGEEEEAMRDRERGKAPGDDGEGACQSAQC